VAEAIGGLKARSLTIDGEIAVSDGSRLAEVMTSGRAGEAAHVPPRLD
jgi:hypothetical protein